MWRTQCKRELLFQPLLSFAPCGPYLGALSCATAKVHGSQGQENRPWLHALIIPLFPSIGTKNWKTLEAAAWSSTKQRDDCSWECLGLVCLQPAAGVGTTCHSLEGRFLACRSWAGDLSSCCTVYSYWLNASAQCGGSWRILGWIKHKFHSYFLIREFEG